MSNNKSTYLPQIEYYYEGSIYPFIGDADLKTLIRWRKEKEDSGIPIGYNKDARNTYFQHMACIEQCIRILFSNPTPEIALQKLKEKSNEHSLWDRSSKHRATSFLETLNRHQKKQLFELVNELHK